MNETQIKCLIVMSMLALIGFGPLSLTCLIGMSVVIWRPQWFYVVVHNLYRDQNDEETPHSLMARVHPVGASIVARIKTFLCLLILLLLDIAPVPVTGAIGLYVVITRPKWFLFLVETIYGDRMLLKTRDRA